MPLIVADRVRDTTTTTGTGTVTLSGTAPTGFQAFSVIGNGNTTYYTIALGTQWEVGIGTYSSTGPTLARNTILESSNAGAAVNFSAGIKDVFVTYPAEKSISDGYGLLPVANGGTGVTTSTGTGSVVLSAGPAFTSDTGSLFTVDGLSGISSNPVVSISGQTNDCLALELKNGIGPARTRYSMQAGGGSADFFIDDAGSTFAGSTYASVGASTVAIYASSAKSALMLGVSGASSSLRFGTNSTERARITAAGDVGIGTSSPSTKLHVAGALTLDTALSAANGGTGLTAVGTSGNVLTSNGTVWVSQAAAAGTVTSVDGSGGTTGLTLTGGPITTSGTLTIGGTLGVANGGTGATTLTGVVIGNGTSAFTTVTAPSGTIVGTTDTQTLTAKTLGNYTETVFAITDGATVDLDPNNGPIQTWTLGANRTPGQTGWAAGQSITLMVDDGSAFAITWSTLAVVWETDSGSAPTLATTGFTVIVLWKVGTTIYGARVGDA